MAQGRSRTSSRKGRSQSHRPSEDPPKRRGRPPKRDKRPQTKPVAAPLAKTRPRRRTRSTAAYVESSIEDIKVKGHVESDKTESEKSS